MRIMPKESVIKNKARKMEIIIYGDIISKKNSKQIVCRGRYPLVLPSRAYQNWCEATLLELKKYRPKNPIERCKIDITFYSKTNRAADLDNKLGSVLDVLVEAGIIVDDNWNCVYQITIKYAGKSEPRAEIKLSTLS